MTSSNDDDEMFTRPSESTDNVESIEYRKLQKKLLDWKHIGKNFTMIMKLLDNINSNDLYKYKYNDQDQSLLHQFLINNFSTSSVLLPDKTILFDIFYKLIRNGCNTNLLDSNGWSLLHYACVFDIPHIVDFLFGFTSFDKTKLINATSTKQLKIGDFYFLIGTTAFQVYAKQYMCILKSSS
jgi:hypothetical protein